MKKSEPGKYIHITKHGHPVAKLVPTGALDREQSRQAIERIKAFSQKHTLGNIDWKTLRDEGRR